MLGFVIRKSLMAYIAYKTNVCARGGTDSREHC